MRLKYIILIISHIMDVCVIHIIETNLTFIEWISLHPLPLLCPFVYWIIHNQKIWVILHSHSYVNLNSAWKTQFTCRIFYVMQDY